MLGPSTVGSEINDPLSVMTHTRERISVTERSAPSFRPARSSRAKSGDEKFGRETCASLVVAHDGSRCVPLFFTDPIEVGFATEGRRKESAQRRAQFTP